MPTILEMATEMVITRAKTTPLTAEEMVNELNRFHTALKKLEAGEAGEETAETAGTEPAPSIAPSITLKDAFKKNEVVCMICGKGGFRTLARHLTTAHGMTPRDYKKQFAIPAKQSLSARAYSESRRQMAKDRGLAGNLQKAREVRTAKLEAAKAKPAAKGKPAKKTS